MKPENPPIIPTEYYEQLCRMGKENLCEGKYVEGMGYILPEVVVTPIKSGKWEIFYDIKISNHIAVVNPNKPDTIPFFIFESRHRTVYSHHVKAITTRGKPIYLTYDSNKVNAENRRIAATNPYPRIPGNTIHRDEYPYATTMEGGLGASVEYVNAGDNLKHGGDLTAVRRAFNMRTGDVFHIILIPQGKEWQPVKQPVFIPELEREKITFPHPNPVPTKEILTWGTVAAAFAVIGKILDMVASRAVIIILPLDPSFYQNQYQFDKDGNITLPPT